MSYERGTVLGGRYRVIRELGEGGMGTVVLAEQLDIGRNVALKLITPALASDATIVERLRREARAAAQISNVHVAQVYALEELGDELALVMEHVDGPSLRAIIKQGKLPVDRAVRVARQLLVGLAAAHASGVVHRDVKPENVLVAKDERGRDHVKLVDFGIAKMAEQTKLTRKGSVIGTPAYLAPEQIRGEEADARSDLWSVGVILHEMIAGSRPFHAPETPDVLREVLQASPPLLSEVAGAPEWLSACVQRALRKSAEERFASAKEMIDALEPRASASPEPATVRPHRRETADAAPKTAATKTAPKTAEPKIPAPEPPRSAARADGFWLGVVGMLVAAVVALWIAFERAPQAESASASGAASGATSGAASASETASETAPETRAETGAEAASETGSEAGAATYLLDFKTLDADDASDEATLDREEEPDQRP